MKTVKDSGLPKGQKNYERIPVPEYPKKILLGIQEDYCNLSCPKCLVFGTNKDPAFDIKKIVTSVMPMENIIRILDEVKDYKPAVSPSYWVEPLVLKNFKDVVREATKRKVPVSIATNGLLINDEMARFLVDHVSLISVSIDATTKETLIKTRSTSRLAKIENAVFLLLEKRGSKESPRILVNFTVEDCNRHEQEEFLQKWIPHVDAVRINGMYTYERTIDNLAVTRERTPCREIYDQMSIDFNGEVRMCCLDGFRVTSLGNVFEEGVYNVWHGEAFTAIRRNHEEKNYGAQPFCETCTLWSHYNITSERQEGDLLIRASNSVTFYNRLDRMSNWKSDLRRNDLEFLPG